MTSILSTLTLLKSVNNELLLGIVLVFIWLALDSCYALRQGGGARLANPSGVEQVILSSPKTYVCVRATASDRHRPTLVVCDQPVQASHGTRMESAGLQARTRGASAASCPRTPLPLEFFPAARRTAARHRNTSNTTAAWTITPTPLRRLGSLQA